MKFLKKNKGQSLVEYALILALVSVVCAGTLTTLAGDINGTLGKVSAKLNGDKPILGGIKGGVPILGDPPPV